MCWEHICTESITIYKKLLQIKPWNILKLLFFKEKNPKTIFYSLWKGFKISILALGLISNWDGSDMREYALWNYNARIIKINIRIYFSTENWPQDKLVWFLSFTLFTFVTSIVLLKSHFTSFFLLKEITLLHIKPIKGWQKGNHCKRHPQFFRFGLQKHQ